MELLIYGLIIGSLVTFGVIVLTMKLITITMKNSEDDEKYKTLMDRWV